MPARMKSMSVMTVSAAIYARRTGKTSNANPFRWWKFRCPLGNRPKRGEDFRTQGQRLLEQVWDRFYRRNSVPLWMYRRYGKRIYHRDMPPKRGLQVQP